MVYYNKIEFGDCRETMRRWAEQGVKAQTCVTSPPYYGLRDYGHDGQIGLEETPEAYINAMVEVFRCVWDVLADDGTLWLNIGDSYAGSGKGSNPDGTPHPSTLLGKQGTNTGTVTGKNMPQKAHKIGLKPKDLIGIPWMLAFALRADGWYLRQDIIWHKPNPMPESVQDRCTKAHEYIFLLSKSQKYYFDNDAIKEPYATADESSASYRKNGKSDSRTKHSIYCPVCDGSGDGLEGENGDDCEVCGGTGRADIGNAKTAVKNDGFWKPDGAGRNKRSVWIVNTKPYKGAHFATFPPALITPCVLAGAPAGGVVLDPFMGSGTTAAVAIANGRNYLGCELNPAYKELQDARIGTPKPTDLFGCQYA